MNDDIRGGCRGQVPFSWDQIKNDSAREHYLGQCLVHEANWWGKAFTKEAVREELAAAAHRTEEIDAVRRREEQLMQEALGLAPKAGASAPPPPATALPAPAAAAASTSAEQGGTWQEAPPRELEAKEGDRTREHKHSHHSHEHRRRRSAERSESAHKHKHRHHHHKHKRSRSRSRSRSPRHTKTKH